MSKKNNSLRTAVVHLSLLLFVIYLVFPMIWIVVTSLKTTPEIYSGVFSLIPKTPTLEHFQTIIAEGQIFRSMLNSLFAGVIATVLVVIIAMPAAYALVGMAAVVAGTTHATLTSILILFELTRNVYVLLPIMLAAVVATVVATVLERDSIYTFKLRREGVLLGGARDISLLRKIPVTSVPIEPLPEDAVFASDPLGKLVSLHANYHVPDFVVVEQDGSYIGMVTGKDMRTALIDREAIPLLLVAELLRTDLPVIHPDETLDVVVDRFAEHDVSSLCLVTAGKNPRPIGLITRIHVMSRYREALEES